MFKFVQKMGHTLGTVTYSGELDRPLINLAYEIFTDKPFSEARPAIFTI